MRYVLSAIIVVLFAVVGCGGDDNGDNDTPVVEITFPLDGSQVSSVVDITVEATDDDGIDSVHFYIDDTLRSTSTAEPYVHTWLTSSLGNGSVHTIYAMAYDTAENVGVSDTISVTVIVEALKWRYLTNYDLLSAPAVGTDGTIYICSATGFYAINHDGTLKWTFYGSPYCSPAIAADGTIYNETSQQFFALYPNGTLKWIFYPSAYIMSSPAIGVDGTIYVGSNSGNLYAINPSGTLKWAYVIGSDVQSSPAIGSDGTIYVGAYGGYLYAMNPDGTLKWSYLTQGDIQSSPAIRADGTIYVGSNDNRLYAIKPDGTLRWVFLTGGDVQSSPAIAPDGTVYFGSGDDYLYAVQGLGSLANTAWPMFHHDLRHTGRTN